MLEINYDASEAHSTEVKTGQLPPFSKDLFQSAFMRILKLCCTINLFQS